MSDRFREIGELDVLAYADGLLDGDAVRKAAVEAYLADHPDLAEDVAVHRRQNDEIRRRFESKLAEPVPDRLYAALSGDRSGGAWKAASRVAAVAALALLAGFSGWLLGDVTDRGGADPVSTFVQAVVASTSSCGCVGTRRNPS